MSRPKARTLPESESRIECPETRSLNLDHGRSTQPLTDAVQENAPGLARIIFEQQSFRNGSLARHDCHRARQTWPGGASAPLAFTNEIQGLSIVAHSDRQTKIAAPEPLWLLEIVGQDRPGIVREISRVLARRGVNVEELETECQSAAMSGEMMFTARAKVRVPAACSVGDLRGELEKIGQDLIVEVSLQQLPTEQAAAAST